MKQPEDTAPGRLVLDIFAILVEIAECPLIEDEDARPMVVELMWEWELERAGGWRLPGPLFYRRHRRWGDKADTAVRITGPALRIEDHA